MPSGRPRASAGSSSSSARPGLPRGSGTRRANDRRGPARPTRGHGIRASGDRLPPSRSAEWPCPHPTLPHDRGEGSIVDFVPDLPPWFYEPKGRYDEHLFESQVLRGNPLGDPDRRPLWVYLPPGHDPDPQPRYPTIYGLIGLTRQIHISRNRPSLPTTSPPLP